VWQDAYPPAIYVRILEIRRVEQSVLGFLRTYVCAPTISTALKVFGPNNFSACHFYISNTNLENIYHFPEF
jgi:hypothetical protein